MRYHYVITANQTNDTGDYKMSDRQIINKLTSRIEELKAEYRSTYGDENLAAIREQIENLRRQLQNVSAFAGS